MNRFILHNILLCFGIIAIMMTLSGTSNAQSLFKKIKDRAAQAATGKILDKTDKAVGKHVDKAIGGTGTTQETIQEEPSNKKEPTDGHQEPPSVKAFSKYDFVPGDSVLYVNDFSNEALGELPRDWNSNGSSVIVKLDGMDGQWLRMAQRTVALTDNKKMLGSDFTVEFDLFLQFDFKGWLPPSVRFGLLASGQEDPTGNSLLSDPKGDKSFYMEVSPLSDGANLVLETYKKYTRHFNSPPQRSTLAKNWYSKVVHVSMQGQKERLRIWMDGEKIYDVPKAIPIGGIFNQLFFQLSSSPYQNEQVGVYITNIKIAKGLPDTRHKLIEEGKFSTTGILFDTGSANIKASSSGVLKSIATVLTENQDVNVQIIGHTDAVGEEQANQQLSELRAKAVKDKLQNTYGIPANRLEALGKGESAPMGDNKTKEGMAQNRRVEFIRL
ncbi:MAG TPA: OmpA family protein [Pseudosphingobacterium sp.]|nr:OmpA family protein [Pseudosphingobacterium sp.]